MMKRLLRFSILWFVFVSLSCSRNEEGPKSTPTTAVKEAVKDVVTQDFKLHQGAKDSLKQSEEKQKSQLEQVDKELK
jgi:hypothetical protein